MRLKVINVLVILVLAISLCLITAAPAGAVNPTTIPSSTMIFEGPLTPDGDGFTGVLPLIDEAAGPTGDGETGFDVYARNGALPYFTDDRGLVTPGSGIIITDHDAYPTWDPDVPDWNYYALILDAGTWKLVYNENNPRDFDVTGAVPMSGTMDWAGMYAAETDVGYCFGYDAATLEAAAPGLAAANGGGAAAWDMDWIWGTDVVPLAFPGFDVDIVDNGGGNYTVTMTPATGNNPPGPVVNADSGESYGAIQAAINDASAGDTINVAAGTYVEAITINKPLTLRGATADVNKNGYTVPADYAWNPAVESIITHPNPAGGYTTIVDIIDTDAVTFEGFVVQELNAVANLNSSLVRVYAQTQEISNIVVRNNIIGPNTNVVLQDGTHGRMGLYIVNHPYDVNGVVNSTFSGNKIFDCKGNGDNVFLWSSYYSYGAAGPASMSGTVIEDNEIYGAHRSGIETAGGYSGLTIRNNTIYGNTGLPGDTPALKYGHGIMLIRGSGDKTDPINAYGPVDLTIENNEIYGNEKNGIYMGPINNNYSITGNDIYNNGWDGIMLDLEGQYWNPTFEPEPIPYNVYACYDGSNNLIAQYNNIYGNTEYGIRVIGTPTNGFTLDATYNWWGHATGPYHATTNADGLGDAVSDYVDYDPWYTDAAMTKPGTSVGMTTTIIDLVSISVTPGGIDFGAILPGAPTDGNPLTIGNEGNVVIDVSAELTNDTDAFYATYLLLNGAVVPAGNLVTDIAINGNSEVTTGLAATPTDLTPKTYTVTIVFWAEKAP